MAPIDINTMSYAEYYLVAAVAEAIRGTPQIWQAKLSDGSTDFCRYGDIACGEPEVVVLENHNGLDELQLDGALQNCIDMQRALRAVNRIIEIINLFIK